MRSCALHFQVYIPIVNYVLYVLCIVVICTFRTTDALGAAYGATPHVSIALMLLISCR